MWYASGLCRLLQVMTVDSVSGLVAIGQLREIDRKAVESQEWFLCNCDDSKIMLLSVELPFVRHRASGAKVREGRWLKEIPRY